VYRLLTGTPVQVATTAALRTGTCAWLLGAVLYLPQSWIEDASRRAVAGIPARVSFQEKWRHAITLIRRARAAGLQLTGVVADAELGDITAFRRLLHQWRLPYALGISHHLTVFRGAPAVHIPPDPRTGRPRSQLVMIDRTTAAITVRALALSLPARAWRRMTWRNGTNRPWAARFAALRVTPANEWRNRRLAPEVWLLCEQDLGVTPASSTSSSISLRPRRSSSWFDSRTNDGRSSSNIKSSRPNWGSIISRVDRSQAGIIT